MSTWRNCQIVLALFYSLFKFSYWSTFHVNVITGSGVMTIFFFKGLTRNLKIGNIPVWVLPNIWRLSWVRDTNIGTDVSNEMLLNATKCQSCSFYCLWVIKRKSTVGVKLPPPFPTPTQTRVKFNKLKTIEWIWKHESSYSLSRFLFYDREYQNVFMIQLKVFLSCIIKIIEGIKHKKWRKCKSRLCAT